MACVCVHFFIAKFSVCACSVCVCECASVCKDALLSGRRLSPENRYVWRNRELINLDALCTKVVRAGRMMADLLQPLQKSLIALAPRQRKRHKTCNTANNKQTLDSPAPTLRLAINRKTGTLQCVCACALFVFMRNYVAHHRPLNKYAPRKGAGRITFVRPQTQTSSHDEAKFLIRLRAAVRVHLIIPHVISVVIMSRF